MLDPIRSGDSAALRKSRGAFFTPEPITRFIAEWAVDIETRTVLEPSCGEAGFLLAAGRSAQDRGLARPALHGIEVFPPSADHARRLLRSSGFEASIDVADFFDVAPRPHFDAVIGNPPYVRYQDHVGAARIASRRAAAESGVELTELASIWAAFTVHATRFLRRGGKLGLVLPAELLSVNYAAPVRRYLLSSFADVTLVLFDHRVFPGVQEEVVLLLGDGFGEGPTDRFTVHQVRDADGLADLGAASTWVPASTSAKWTGSLLSGAVHDLYSTATAEPAFTVMHSWGETSLGAVTGNNRFFTLTAQQMQDFGLRAEEYVRISPPGSRHLRLLELNDASWDALRSGGSPVYLFRPTASPSSGSLSPESLSPESLSPGATELIAQGESIGVHSAYKCRTRTPWWRVPVLSPPDLFLTYMNADTPRLTTNHAGVRHLNSVHGVYAGVHRDLARSLLPLASLNSVTRLGAEIVGRAYGGGMLKLEPREADEWPVPSAALLEGLAPSLEQAREDARLSLASGDPDGAVALVDDIVLGEGLGMARSEIGLLRTARDTLAARRRARGAGRR